MRGIAALLLLAAPLCAHAQAAHFHHVHLNTTDPAAAIEFYTSKFKARKESFAGEDAVWTGDSWLLFTKVDAPPPSEPLSGIWHIGWGAEDMQSTYQLQLAQGTRFATPISDISDLVGDNRPADHISMILYPVEYRGGTIVPTRGRVVDHLGFSVDDLDATVARLRQDGVKVTAEPRTIADGKIRSAFIAGPDRVAIELLQDATPRPGPVED
jgi:catechol 2,3-dioxygenase-like lactoylglutathione lyase family enzyme